MTNKAMAARYRKLADYIAAQPAHNFKQDTWFCGTAACIAGHCAIMLGWSLTNDDGNDVPLLRKRGKIGNVEEIAALFLGLVSNCTVLLESQVPWNTKAKAVKELRKRAAAIEAGYSPCELDAISA